MFKDISFYRQNKQTEINFIMQLNVNKIRKYPVIFFTYYYDVYF